MLWACVGGVRSDRSQTGIKAQQWHCHLTGIIQICEGPHQPGGPGESGRGKNGDSRRMSRARFKWLSAQVPVEVEAEAL